MQPYGGGVSTSSETKLALEQAVRKRAYALWEEEGGPDECILCQAPGGCYCIILVKPVVSAYRTFALQGLELGPIRRVAFHALLQECFRVPPTAQHLPCIGFFLRRRPAFFPGNTSRLNH